MDSTAKVEYNVRNLTTRAVTLFPTKAQVFRDIKDVPLQPGTNEITIVGLTPTVDEDSIKVEGSGSAIISDIAVESLPNPDIFEDVYPDSDDDMSAGEEELDDEEVEPPESAELIAAKARSQELQNEIESARELVQSADSRQDSLDDYAKTLSCQHNVDIESSMESYRQLREAIFRDRMQGQGLERQLEQETAKAAAEVERLSRIHRREKAKANKGRKKASWARLKAKMKKDRREEERLNEKHRVREERAKFWPKYCHAVRITLEANSFTPQTSRRNSVSSDVEMVGEPPQSPSGSKGSERAGSCDLVLSYVTSSASWTPSYDLQLSTTSTNGTLCFDAQLNNNTSETWEKAKITLSTSQTTSSSLGDMAPDLSPWRIKLDNYKGGNNNDNALLYSGVERSQKALLNSKKAPGNGGKNRYDMFGVDSRNMKPDDFQSQMMMLEQINKTRLAKARLEQPQAPGMGMPPPTAPARRRGVVRHRAPPNDEVEEEVDEEATAEGQQQRQLQQMMMQQQQQQQQQQYQQQQQQQYQQYQPQQQPQWTAHTYQIDNLAACDLDDLGTETNDQQQLDFEESLVEETGFTTTYDLPGLKTLIPKSSSSKQRIARVSFANVIFSHTVVAKYKPAAYLSAKLQNTSKLTLLRGPVGVTLDGSFMGRTTLPRCGAGGESIKLSLGVDPAITVVYAPPEMQRATTGFFTKEDIKLYSRVVRLENTRTSNNRHTKLLVRDQIPVSRDDKVRVELLKPEELVPEGEAKAAGEAGRDKDKDAWGTAEARLQKDGEVNWLVALRPGRSVKLVMEYLVATPIGDQAIEG